VAILPRSAPRKGRSRRYSQWMTSRVSCEAFSVSQN
jgi:hypothetical protein